MCGIAGIFNTDGKPVSTTILKKMTDKISHRGPDGEGQWCDKYIGLGHRRLSIIDLTQQGQQPMQTEDGRYSITYNGEVYNFQNIRTQLESKGYTFKSRTDSEVVLKSFQEWGTDSFLKFNGIFAYAIWDSLDEKMYLVRDRYGVKPLYYYYKDSTLVFASEIKAILENPVVNKEVCLDALNEYFSFQNIFSDKTLFNDIYLLQPGYYHSYLLNNETGGEKVNYWDYKFREDSSLDYEESSANLCLLFENAVNRQLISDVDVGAYLSGGLDSGSITSVATKSIINLKTFTCGFDLSSASGLELGFDERQKAEFLSNKFKTEHYEVVLKAGDMERVMNELIYHLEDLRVGQCYPNYYVARLASKFVKVVLSGAGGDELFAGYPWRYYRMLSSSNKEEYYQNYYRYWQRLIPESKKRSFFNENVWDSIKDYSTYEVFKSVISDRTEGCESVNDYINLSLYFEIKTFLHGLLIVEDKLSMAHSLETRVPFLDNDLVDFAMKIPVKFKLNNLANTLRINENEPASKSDKYHELTNDGKKILRDSLSKYIPDNYTSGHKQGFSAPDGSWFKGESIEYIKQILHNKNSLIYNYLQYNEVNSLIEDHFSGKVNRRLLIWSLLCFEWWLKIYMN